jgi:uncharacterized protein (TIGR02266 family)
MTTPVVRRAHDRLEVDLEVTIRYDGREIEARCTNISQGGMFIQTETITIGENVTVVFSLPGIPKPIEAESRVCWSERDDRMGIGVQFNGLRAIEVWAVNQLFQKRAKEKT